MTTLSILLGLVMSALPLPETGAVPPNAVDYATVEALVLRKAQAEWPESRLGTVIPYLDEAGATVAYMFHFRTDGRPFPNAEEVRDDVLADRDRLTVNTSTKDYRSRYSFILASARYDRPPFICYGYGSSEFYAIGQRALARAADILGYGARLTRMYFIHPKTFLEFSDAQGRRVVLGNRLERTWNSREAFVAEMAKGRADSETRTDINEVGRIHRQKWDEAMERDFTDFAEYYVPQVAKAPFYDWSYGCTPTSGAMVLGYIDRTQNYGRLVDYYFQRWDQVEGETDWQIPYTQRECALSMSTDTTTGGTYVSYIANGLRNAANGYSNGYSFTVTERTGSSSNDWAWSTITSEIGSGYAFIWSALWEQHSLSCFGYRTPEKDVFVHNTWWAPGVWWHYAGSSQSHIASPHPVGGEPRNLHLIFPKGDTLYNSTGRGNVLQVGDTAHVTWTNNGNPGTKVDIDISTNGGRNWSVLATNLPDNGLYKWHVSPSLPAQDSVRLRLKQYNSATYTSGDASFGNVTLNREPLPPAFISPPNGQQIFTPPVVLVVDSLYKGDSLDFRLIYGSDTLVRHKTTDWRCPLPDSLFIYGRSYRWTCRAHNQYGWGKLGTNWSFWVRFNTGVEEGQPVRNEPELSVASLNLLGGEVAFSFARPATGQKLLIYNALGVVIRELAVTGPLVKWDMCDEAGRTQSAGLYFAQLKTGSNLATARFILIE